MLKTNDAGREKEEKNKEEGKEKLQGRKKEDVGEVKTVG